MGHISTNYFAPKISGISNKATSNFQAKNMKVCSVVLPLLILFVFPFAKTEKELKCQIDSWFWTGEDTEKNVAPYMVSSCSDCLKNFHQDIIDIVINYGV